MVSKRGLARRSWRLFRRLGSDLRVWNEVRCKAVSNKIIRGIVKRFVVSR
jgi:hypothetical protein